MPASGPPPGQVAVQVSLAAIFVSLELSRWTWLITSLVPGGGDKMSELPPHWWTPLLSSEGSGKVSNGPGTASFYG